MSQQPPSFVDQLKGSSTVDRYSKKLAEDVMHQSPLVDSILRQYPQKPLSWWKQAWNRVCYWIRRGE